jgi:hypothetical protein
LRPAGIDVSARASCPSRAGRSAGRYGGACSPDERRAAATGRFAVGRSGPADAGEERRRPAGKLRTVGAFLAVAATVCTGRLNTSDTSATITGVAAALSSVPGPHSRDTANDAIADATLAMASVCGEMPLPARYSVRAGAECSRREETDTLLRVPGHRPTTFNGSLRSHGPAHYAGISLRLEVSTLTL